MYEDSPQPEKGKFDSPRDELLHHLCLEGWATASNGSVQAPSGYFARISNAPEDIPAIVQAFEDAIHVTGLATTDSLIGHFVVAEDDQGFVSVSEHPTEAGARAEYAIYEEVYDMWCEVSGE